MASLKRRQIKWKRGQRTEKKAVITSVFTPLFDSRVSNEKILAALPSENTGMLSPQTSFALFTFCFSSSLKGGAEKGAAVEKQTRPAEENEVGWRRLCLVVAGNLFPERYPDVGMPQHSWQRGDSADRPTTQSIYSQT